MRGHRWVVWHFSGIESSTMIRLWSTTLCPVVPTLATCSGDASIGLNSCSIELLMTCKTNNRSSSNGEMCRSARLFLFPKVTATLLNVCIWHCCRNDNEYLQMAEDTIIVCTKVFADTMVRVYGHQYM